MFPVVAAMMLVAASAQVTPTDISPPVPEEATGGVPSFAPLDQSDAKALEILWPVPYYVRAGKEMTGNSKRLELLLKQTGVPHRFSFMPIKRAFHLYGAAKAGCTPYGSVPLTDGDLISKPFTSIEQWFYVRADAGIQKIDDIQTAAALEGVKRFFRPTGYDRISWQYAPSYSALMGMLKNRRVQAVTLGPGARNGAVKLPDGVTRVGDKPFVRMELRLHCRPTPEAQALIDRMDAIIKAGGR
ncbi:hypothetical protein [Kordiimonas marina]|uniref:hypothetical protein n=1 Tax=Kordiimonas marina TaxID=2872312 RepID=UPI001FF435FB|nr:hypothetical protein [Kordiimonas marina]MCJ9428665.1 hypothetical protein [Kordiimonas marina]